LKKGEENPEKTRRGLIKKKRGKGKTKASRQTSSKGRRESDRFVNGSMWRCLSNPWVFGVRAPREMLWRKAIGKPTGSRGETGSCVDGYT